MEPNLLLKAQKHIADILKFAIEYSREQNAIVVFDRQCSLTNLLEQAYRHCLPEARFIDFNTMAPADILETFAPLEKNDLVVMIQSTSFRLETFRIRVELFKKGLKVIEHPHLLRMDENEIILYIDSLAYDPNYYRIVGAELKARIDKAEKGLLVSLSQSNTENNSKETLTFPSPFEKAKLNVGDYRELVNTGGQFPIGEVFTEARDLESVEGRVSIFAFADINFQVHCPVNPITLVIEKGRVSNTINSVPEFDLVLANIRADEGEVRLREIGLGMNRAFSPTAIVRDVGTMERMCGIHLSLGAKHHAFQKPDLNRRSTKHHVDVFVNTESFSLDGEELFRGGGWSVHLHDITENLG